MLRAIVLQHLHSRPTHRVSAGQSERIHVAVGSGSRAANDLAKFEMHDNAHDGFGVADGPAIGKENPLGSEVWLFGFDGPASFCEREFETIGETGFGNIPLRAVRRIVG